MSIHDHNFDPWNGHEPSQPHFYACYIKHRHSRRMSRVMIGAFSKAQAKEGCGIFLRMNGLDDVFDYFAIYDYDTPTLLIFYIKLLTSGGYDVSFSNRS